MQPTNQLIIPGRPQARIRNGSGRLLDVAIDYVRAVRHAARPLTQPDGTPANPTTAIPLNIELTYTSEHDIPPSQWHHESIPNADTAATLILQALTGSLYTHASQANPLIVTRRLITPLEATTRWGRNAERGCTIITWQRQDN